MAATLAERFSANVDKTDACWLWTGPILQNGYGRLSQEYAHRISHELFVGPIPAHLEIDHLCRVRNCVNPAHLEAVTHAENIRRGAAARARARASERRAARRASTHAEHLARVRVLMGWS